MVARAEAEAGFAVKVFVEKEQVAPMRIECEALVVSVAGTAAFFVGEKNSGEAGVEFAGDLLQIHEPS